MTYVLQREVKPIGYSIETGGKGTDPGGVRLGFLGWSVTGVLKINENKKPFHGIGSGLNPTGYMRGKRVVEFELSMEALIDDNPDNSLLSLALGDAPNAGTGAITLRPNTTNNNLRSISIEFGYDTAGTDRYYVLDGCVMEKYEMTMENNQVGVKCNWVGEDITPAATVTGTLPSLSSVRPFDPDLDSTWTFSNPTVTGLDIRKAVLLIENKLEKSGSMGQGRINKVAQICGRDVYMTLTLARQGTEFEADYLADPSGTSAEQDIACVLSKNTAAQYISMSLADCQVVDPISIELNDKEETMKDTYKFHAKTHTWDVKA